MLFTEFHRGCERLGVPCRGLDYNECNNAYNKDTTTDNKSLFIHDWFQQNPDKRVWLDSDVKLTKSDAEKIRVDIDGSFL